MNASKWEKLRKNITLLQTEVDVECVLIPYLTENDVLEIGCRTEFEGLINERQIDHLLLKLKGLPEDKDAYEHLLKGLRTSGFDEYSKIADKIDATETESDSSLYAKVSPAHYSKEVREVLNANFTNIEGQTTSLLHVQAVLKKNIAFGRASWSNEELKAFVCQLFAGVEIVKKQDFLKTRTDIFFKHLAETDHKDDSQSSQASRWSKDQDVNIFSLTASQVASFLKGKFEKEQMSVESLLEMEKQDITGEILLDLNEDDLKTVMPSSTFGQRRKIKKIIDEFRMKLGSKQALERLRPFDKDIKPSDWYVLGNIVDTKIQTRGKKLMPIRNFHLPEQKSDNEIRQYIVIQCAIFAAACVNERQNGTIYFGIAPDETGGRKKGQIEGIPLSLGEMDDRVVSLFFPSQEHIIKNALRNAKYVPVFKDDKCSALPSKPYVIEFDVVPASCMREEEYIRINAKDLPNPIENYKTTEPVFTFSEHGLPKVLSPAEICSNTKVPSSTIKKRGKDEYVESRNPKRVNCITRLRNHLTGGSNKMEDDIYKVLLLSSIGESSIDVKSLVFIRNLEPEVVFDFDPRGEQGVFHALEEQEEVLKVVTLDDFDEKKRGKKDVKILKTELTESHFLNWVFCNGFDDVEQVNAIQWNKKRRPAFRKAFNHYLENCHKDRLLIIICLFSHNDILVEACDEILTDLSDQWILLSEQMSDAEMWQETFKSRNRVDRDDLKHRCIIGLTWEQVSKGISTWCMNDNSTVECQIPHSSGTTVNVEKRKLNEWNDVEILSSLDPVEETFEDKQMQVEKEFYRGEQVQWLNFFLKQVCQRSVHEELFSLVSVSLEGRSIEDDGKVLPVYLFHQPGAGGTTSAKEILWSLRKRYRCCVMKRITDQTVDQLIEIFSFKEKSCPKPLLILIDNEDETQIRVNLEEKIRSRDVYCHIFCVLLICYRTTFVPFEKRKLSMVTLQQSLNKDELSWFEMRYKDLKGRYDDPKSLISFNILKENFNKSYIQKTVTEFVKDINNENEEIILKFVSLINTFDLDFKPIHVSCFDIILKSIGSESRSSFSTSMVGGRKTSWEANVSQSFKVLLNLNNQNTKTRKTVRVFHKLIAKHILNAIIAKTGESESELISSLLTDDIFEERGKDMRNFQNIITNMIKKRGTKGDSLEKDKFSPLILSVRKKEGTDKAVEVMKTLFWLNNDPFTAQQIARFYIDCKMFKEAEEYAENAVSIMPNKVSLMNTYAQVFKVQLLEEIQAKNVSPETQFTEMEFKDLIALCMRCTSLFQEEQGLSELGNDEPGYFGELESVELILKALLKCKCFGSRSKAKDISHKYLVNDDYTHNRLKFLSPDENEFLKSLWTNSKEAIRALDDKYLQMKEEIEINPMSMVNESKKKLHSFKTYLYDIFGESSDNIPSNLNEQDTCGYRSRLMFSKKASSLSETLDLKHCQKMDELSKCYLLILKNVQSEYVTLGDLKTMLDIATVLLLDGPIPRGLKFEDMIRWTKKFYQDSWKENGKPNLEAFMYFFLYNFPTEERQKFRNLAPAPDLPPVLESWKETFNMSKRRSRTITHRETTLFFLGKGQPLQDIVYQQKLQGYVVEKEGVFSWDSQKIGDILRPMEGILMPNGDYINFTDKRNKTDHEIRIKTAYRITKDFMWRNKVYFYLGFSFSGLKAYGVTNIDPKK